MFSKNDAEVSGSAGGWGWGASPTFYEQFPTHHDKIKVIKHKYYTNSYKIAYRFPIENYFCPAALDKACVTRAAAQPYQGHLDECILLERLTKDSRAATNPNWQLEGFSDIIGV